MTKFVVKRIYEPAEPSDGYRVLLDRLWPRGVSKERAALKDWAKDLAPSTDLRKWFNHVPAKFPEFSHKYQQELAANPALPEALEQWHKHAVVTLLYGAKDQTHNEAQVLKQYLSR
ncbi:DUF488 family protein [Candidatus Saccharibacteria bacterium]|nr:DUF488 family protein [Candidatus Saccharibacteria bacterium]HPG37174.1 DUF488 family protein [Candidatus Saccharibacteria bacterium]